MTRTSLDNKVLVSLPELQEIFSVGTRKLDLIATEAGAVVRIGKRKLYNVEKMKAFFDSISE